MHGITTIAALNEAAARGRKNVAWPDPVPANKEASESSDARTDGLSPLPDTPDISRAEQ